MSFERDTLFATPLQSGRFSFDEATVSVFPDMIRRSVPGYAAMVAMIAEMAVLKHREQTEPQANAKLRVLDLGCSLGAVGLAMIGRMKPDELSIHGVDLSPSMIEKAALHFVL